MFTTVWELAVHIRFEAFEYTPPEEKRKLIRVLMGMQLNCKEFQDAMRVLLQFNQFHKLLRLVTHLRRRRLLANTHISHKDLDLVSNLFWEEPVAVQAGTILYTLLEFPCAKRPGVWNSGTNLLLQATCWEEKECALMYMDAFMDV